MLSSRSPDTTMLGSTNILIGHLGVGTWAWGGSYYWGETAESDTRTAFEASLDNGINFFDCAEIYGGGRSEELLGKYIRAKSRSDSVVVATKFFPFPWRLGESSLAAALRDSLRRLGLERVDLYQLHWPFGPRSIDTWLAALADVVEAGLARYGGVSNYDVAQTRHAHTVLADRGLSLVSNQVPYSLLDRRVEYSGLLDTCRELGVTVLAYSPLAQGALTGKYTPANPPTGIRGWRYSRGLLERIQPLINLMREIAHAYGDKTPAQVALNWTICKGTVPIPGAKNERQARDNSGALGWRLTEDEIAALDAASQDLSNKEQ